MKFLQKPFFIVLFTALIVGCAAPLASGMPLGAPLALVAAQSTYVLAPADATVTPTPFQPIPPTPEGASIIQPVPEVSPSAVPTPSTPVPTPVAKPTDVPELAQLPSQLNIALLGSDRRPDESGFRTDTIVLVTLNTDQGTVNVTSFPRDLYINLPGYGNGRINTAWTFGGHNMLVNTFKTNFGIKIDRYALINFSSFKQIVDGLGGLTVNVTEPVSDYRAGYWVNVPAGPVKMDADMVLWYVRTRKTTNDIKRNQRQQEVLQAMFEKLLSLNAIRRAPEFYNLYKNDVQTDIKITDILALLPFAAKVAETRDIHHYFITYKQVYDWITPEGAMVLVPNHDALMQVIKKSQNIP